MQCKLAEAKNAIAFYPSVPNYLVGARVVSLLNCTSFHIHSADELESQQGIAHLTEHVAYMGSRKRELLFGTGSQTNGMFRKASFGGMICDVESAGHGDDATAGSYFLHYMGNHFAPFSVRSFLVHDSAYTDFHHTVFYAVCPVNTPRGGAPMLPMALDALVDVMEARVESSRLEKERAAVLSEMTMVNTIEYRVECQILSTLHRENRLAKRFPIGKEKLIRSWQTDDVKSWHRTHYRPDNVVLYLVGDVNPDEAEQVIAEKFGRVTAEKQGSEIKLKEIKIQASDLADAVVEGSVKAAQSWHYPPVRHDWCVPKDYPVDPKLVIPADKVKYDLQLQDSYPLDEKVDFLNTEAVGPGKKIRPHIFR